MLGCFNPNLVHIWTNPNVGLKMSFKNIQLKVKVEVTFLTQHLDLSVFDPNLGWNNPALFRVQLHLHCRHTHTHTTQDVVQNRRFISHEFSGVSFWVNKDTLKNTVQINNQWICEWVEAGLICIFIEPVILNRQGCRVTFKIF